MGFLIGFPLFIVAPCVVAAWIGTRVRWPVVALVVTWLLTPLVSFFVTVLGTPILRAISPAGNDGTAAIMLPFLGVFTGLVAGLVTSGVVRRRNIAGTAKPTDNEGLPNE